MPKALISLPKAGSTPMHQEAAKAICRTRSGLHGSYGLDRADLVENEWVHRHVRADVQMLDLLRETAARHAVLIRHPLDHTANIWPISTP